MPYIIPEARERIQSDGDEAILTPGELNYAVTCTVMNYLDRAGISYSTMNEVIGVLECAKLELYRRMVVPYEQKKIEENGDVYN